MNIGSRIHAYARHLLSIRFVRDILTMQAGTVVYMLVTFAGSIVIARLLGLQRFGVYAVATSFVGTISLITNLGQGSALLVFLAEERGKNDRNGMSAVLRNYANVAVVNSTILLLLAVAAPILLEWSYGSSAHADIVRALLLFQVTELWNSLTIIVLQAMREIRWKVYFEQALRICGVLAAVGVLVMGRGVLAMVTAQLAVGCVFVAFSVITLRRVAGQHKLPGLREVLGVRMSAAAKYFWQGILISIDKNIGNFFPTGLLFVLSLVAQPATVGLARIACQLAALPRMLFIPQVGDLSLTVLARIKAEGNAVLRRRSAQIIKHAVAGHAAVSFLALIGLPPLVWIAYGPEYSEAVPLSLWLILFSLPVSLCVANSPILRLFRCIHYSIIQSLFSWAVMLGVLTVVARAGMPLIGFAIAYGIGMFMPVLLAAYIFLRLIPPQRHV